MADYPYARENSMLVEAFKKRRWGYKRYVYYGGYGGGYGGGCCGGGYGYGYRKKKWFHKKKFWG